MKRSSNDSTIIPLPFTFCHQSDKSQCRNEVGCIDYAELIKDNVLFGKSENRRSRSTKEDERVWQRRWGKREGTGKVLIMQPQFWCPIKYKIFSCVQALQTIKLATIKYMQGFRRATLKLSYVRGIQPHAL